MNKNPDGFDVDKEDLVVIVDEEGNEYQCVIIDTALYKNKNYVSLVPAEILKESELDEEECVDTNNLFIMQLETSDDGDFLKNIEDEEDYNEICQIMIDRLSEDFDIEY